MFDMESIIKWIVRIIMMWIYAVLIIQALLVLGVILTALLIGHFFGIEWMLVFIGAVATLIFFIWASEKLAQRRLNK